jgi:protein ImuB|tara:strand:- start:379 stop:1908 length:1530 start_codon:yes stop_codon:yes gene_type:complete
MATSNCSNNALWLCLHFPHLSLEIFTRSIAPEKAQHPVVVLDRQRVVFLNPAATDVGIQIGSSMDTAYSLSALVTSIERDEKKEIDAINYLAHWCYQFTPTVCVKTCVKSGHSLLLEISGCLKLFGGLSSLRQRVTTGLKALGYRCQMATCATPLGALLLAKADADAEAVATGSPPLQTIEASLQRVAIVHMEADEEIFTSLHNMGIQQMGELFALPISGLGKRFGQQFMDYLYRLTGSKADPQQSIRPAPEFFSEIHFLSDVTNSQSLIFPMKRLLAELTDFLTCRQLTIDKFVWQLKHRFHPAESITVHMANPENNHNMFLALTQLQLEQFQGMSEIDSLSLLSKRFSPANLQAANLFQGTQFRQMDGRIHEQGNREEHTMLLNMFRARLGPGTCFGLSLANDHRPEKAWQRIPLDQKEYWHPNTNEPNNPRPLYLLSPPKPLRENRGFPLLHGQLQLLQGPERIDFGWWEKNTPRDYYIARHNSGAFYWVFNHLTNGKWYLHGIFS